MVARSTVEGGREPPVMATVIAVHVKKRQRRQSWMGQVYTPYTKRRLRARSVGRRNTNLTTPAVVNLLNELSMYIPFIALG
jgi:hypothetical protein